MEIAGILIGFINIFVLAAHSFIIVIVIKVKLRDNRFFLIQTLSLCDLLFSVNTLCYIIILWSNNNNAHLLTASFSCIGFVFHALSLQITTLITLDRFMAVKFGIHYYQIVNKTRLTVAIVMAFMIDTMLFSLSYIFDDNIIPGVWRITFHGLVYTAILRIGTCFAILVIGKITLKIRDEKVIDIKKTRHLHGSKAENLHILQNLKRSIKDIVVLNFWTCIFLVPISICSLLMLCGVGVESRLLSITIMFSYLAPTLSNPIIYVMSQSKIRNRVFKRSNIGTSMI